MSLANDLQTLFPGSHPIEPHPWVAEFLDDGETVVWQGDRERAGEYSIARKVVGAVLFVVAVPLVAKFSGVSLGLLREVLADNPGQVLVPIGVVALLVLVGMIRSLRDPKEEWAYAVTDKRLLTFFKGKNVRAAGVEDVERFAVRRNIESRLRGIGDVTWRIGTRIAADSGGPDFGRHGFLAIREPHALRDRLKRWRDLVYADADTADLAFAGQVAPSSATGGAADAKITSATVASVPEVDVETIRIVNSRYGFAITVPSHWSGRMAIREVKRAKLLGFEIPIPTYHYKNEAELPATAGDWNYLDLSGSADVTLALEVLEEPVPTTYAAEMAGMKARGELDAIVQSNEAIDQPPFRGFSIVADLKKLKVPLDTGVVRRVWLGTEAFHLSIHAKVVSEDSGAQSEAMDAMVKSIGPL